MTNLPADMRAAVTNVKAKGGKCFLALPEGGAEGCRNCRGTGNLILQTVTGGPWDTPPAQSKGKALIREEEGWYSVRTAVYTCGDCNGIPAPPRAWRPVAMLPEVKERIGVTAAELKALEDKRPHYERVDELARQAEEV